MRRGGERAFSGIVREICELKRAEAEVRSRRDDASALVASTQDGLAVLALDGELVEVDRR
jgi:PAS domain-containing protein